jgi:magnesium transporter
MIATDILASLQSGDFAGLRDALTSLRPPEAAEALSTLSKGDLVIAFRVLPRRFASDVFEYFQPALQETLVKTMGQEDVAAVLNHMSPDDRTRLFGELPWASIRPRRPPRSWRRSWTSRAW